MNKPKRERFMMVKAECYELLVSPEGLKDKKRVAMAIIDFDKVETISEGDTANESILYMNSGGKFYIKTNFYELKAKYERYHGKID